MIRCVIFDLDGVIVSTDEYHYLGWQKVTDEEGVPFDRGVNEHCRGVSRMESLDIILAKATRAYSPEERLAIATRKNDYYRRMLEETLSAADILPGVMPVLEALKARGVKIAVGSSSRNTPLILDRIGLAGFFDAVADGNDIQRSKPDPEVFLLAAARCQVPPAECLVVEDAVAGVEAALNGRMKVLAVGYAARDERADLRAADLRAVSVEQLLAL